MRYLTIFPDPVILMNIFNTKRTRFSPALGSIAAAAWREGTDRS